MRAAIMVVSLILIGFALRGKRWAYVSYIVLSLAYFPMRSGFDLAPSACQLAFGADLALLSMTNYAHVILFAIFFAISAIHFGGRRWAARSILIRAGIATVLMGAAVELAQGATGNGNCRLRDLIPDTMGAALGAILLVLTHRLAHRGPGRVRPPRY